MMRLQQQWTQFMTDRKSWLIFGGVFLTGWLLYILSPILTPFLVGALLAYLVNPLVSLLERWHLPRLPSVVIVFVLLILILVLAVIFCVPILERQFSAAIIQIPLIIGWVNEQVIPLVRAHTGFDIETIDTALIKNVLFENWKTAGGAATYILRTITHSSFGLILWLTNFLLIPVVTFYLLRDWGKLIDNVRILVPRAYEGTVVRLVGQCHEVLGAFIRGQLMVMLCLGVVYGTGLTWVGLSTAGVIGLFAGLFSIVPYLGVFVGVLSASLAALFQFHDWPHLIGVFLVFGTGQILEGWVLTPTLVGERIGLHPVAVIFSILAGGQLFGFTGVLLALPAAAVIMVLVRELYKRYLNSRVYGQSA